MNNRFINKSRVIFYACSLLFLIAIAIVLTTEITNEIFISKRDDILRKKEPRSWFRFVPKGKFEVALERMAEGNKNEENIRQIIDLLDNEEIGDVLNVLLVSDDSGPELIKVVFRTWTIENPEAALKWLEPLYQESILLGGEWINLRELAGRRWAKKDFGNAIAWMRNLREAVPELSLAAIAYGELGRHNRGEALRLISEEREPLRKAGMGFIFATWAEAAPAEAFAQLGDICKDSVTFSYALNRWGEKDPEAVISWLLEPDRFPAEQLGSILITLGTNWSDFNKKSVLFERIQDEDLRFQVMSFIALNASASNNIDSVFKWLETQSDADKISFVDTLAKMEVSNKPNATIPFIMMLPEGEGRNKMLDEKLKAWAESDLDAVLKWAKIQQGDMFFQAYLSSLRAISMVDSQCALAIYNQENFEAGEKERVVTAIANGWAEINPLDAMNWKIQEMGEQAFSSSAHIVSEWLKQNPEAALDWAQTISNTKNKNLILTAIYDELSVAVAPDKAVQYLTRIEDTEKRNQYTLQTVLNWMSRDKKAAQDWMRTSQLPKETKEYILNQ